MPLIGTFTFYLRRRAQVKTRTVSNQLLNGQQVPIIWFRFLVQATWDIFHFSENISKSNDQWVKQLPTWSLEISFTGKNSDNFSYFRKHQWIDFFIIIHIIINKVDAEFSLKLQLTLSRGLNFPSILFTYHPWAVVNTIVEGSQNGVFCWIRRLAPLMKAPKLMEISAWSYSSHLGKGWDFHLSIINCLDFCQTTINNSSRANHLFDRMLV